ncbi:MAG: CYTH domain-containing protein [Gammaproteobacteria bacterium]|nr:MAG: CYTH domain-containing protein [Gammaproteobacteria bacterium]
MPREIERKFLVRSDAWRRQVVRSIPMVQGYLTRMGHPECTRSSVRVRVAGDRAWLNIKRAELGVSRLEFEYPIPVEEARELLGRLAMGALIEKTRHEVPVGRHVWEIDVFGGANAGLVLAEIELEAADEPFERPEWLGEEVSHDPRYYNTSLVEHPYSRW